MVAYLTAYGLVALEAEVRPREALQSSWSEERPVNGCIWTIRNLPITDSHVLRMIGLPGALCRTLTGCRAALKAIRPCAAHLQHSVRSTTPQAIGLCAAHPQHVVPTTLRSIWPCAARLQDAAPPHSDSDMTLCRISTGSVPNWQATCPLCPPYGSWPGSRVCRQLLRFQRAPPPHNLGVSFTMKI